MVYVIPRIRFSARVLVPKKKNRKLSCKSKKMSIYALKWMKRISLLNRLLCQTRELKHTFYHPATKKICNIFLDITGGFLKQQKNHFGIVFSMTQATAISISLTVVRTSTTFKHKNKQSQTKLFCPSCTSYVKWEHAAVSISILAKVRHLVFSVSRRGEMERKIKQFAAILFMPMCLYLWCGCPHHRSA